MHPRMFLPAAVVGAVIGYVDEVAQWEIVFDEDTDRFMKFVKF